MGREARRNESAGKASAAGYQRPERVTVARVRRSRRAELRSQLASLIAGQAILNSLQRNEKAKSDEHAARLARRAAGKVTVTRIDETDDAVVSSAETPIA